MGDPPLDMMDETAVEEEEQSHIRAETQALRIVVMHQNLKNINVEAEAIKMKGSITKARYIEENDEKTINK